jgi:YegS/Rv2252/BmrU family lipid kinase
MARPALIVYNPGAHGGASALDPLRVAATLRGWGFAPRLVETRGPRTLHDIRLAVRHGVSVVIGMGGDGTLHLLANALARSQTVLGVVPLGTGNDFARSLNLPLDPFQALEVIRTGRVRRVDLGRVNGHYFLNVAGVGMSSELHRLATADDKRRWGKWSYWLAFARHLAHRHALPIEIDVAPGLHAAYQVLIANGPSFGGGMRVAEEATVTEGLLDTVVVEPGWRSLLAGALAPRKTLIERLASRHVRSRRVTLRTPGPVELMLDGDRHRGRSPLQFEVVPRALRVLVPG